MSMGGAGQFSRESSSVEQHRRVFYVILHRQGIVHDVVLRNERHAVAIVRERVHGGVGHQNFPSDIRVVCHPS